MNQIISEDFPSKKLIKFLRGFSLLLVIFGALLFMWSPPAGFFILFIILPVALLFCHYYFSMSPLVVECREKNYLIVSKGGAEVWRGAVENVKDVGFQGGRVASLILYLKDGDSISFGVNKMREDQVNQIRSFLK